MAETDSGERSNEEQHRYWRNRDRVEKIKLLLWLIFQMIRDSGLGPRDFRLLVLVPGTETRSHALPGAGTPTRDPTTTATIQALNVIR
jgi:hypothetical protein